MQTVSSKYIIKMHRIVSILNFIVFISSLASHRVSAFRFIHLLLWRLKNTQAKISEMNVLSANDHD